MPVQESREEHLQARLREIYSEFRKGNIPAEEAVDKSLWATVEFDPLALTVHHVQYVMKVFGV